MRAEFSDDEKVILMIYAEETREETLAGLRGMVYRTAADEVELRAMGNSVIEKLKRMSDEEFGAMDIYGAL